MPRSTRPRPDVATTTTHSEATPLSGQDLADRERFFDHYYGRVHSYVARAVRDPHLAEDLTHDILMKVDTAFARIDPSRDPSAWVFTIAANAIRDHWRRRSTHVARTAIAIDTMHDPPQDGAARVDDALIEAERHERLHRALDELSEDDRQVIELRTFQDMATDDVAHALGARSDAVRKRWSRAVHRLGDAYHALDVSEDDAA